MDTVGLNTSVQVPTTAINKEVLQFNIKQGLRAVPTSSGIGRTITDLSYFENIIVKKNKDINDEMLNIKAKTEKLEKDNEAFIEYQRQYEELMKEVRDLEGTLADYNLASDKARNQYFYFNIIVLHLMILCNMLK